MACGHVIEVPGPTKSNWCREVVRCPCGTVDICQGVRHSREAREASGTSGRPTEARGPSWTWVSWDFPRTSSVLPALSERSRSSPECPWSFLGIRTSQRLLPASPGRPDVPGASPGLWDVRMCQGGCPGLFEVSYAFPEVPQTGMTDRISPVSEAAAVPALQRHVFVTVLWFETFGPVPPLGGSYWLGRSPGNLCLLVLFCLLQSRFGSSSTSRTLTVIILRASWRTRNMMRVNCHAA